MPLPCRCHLDFDTLITDVIIEFGHNDVGSPSTSDRASVGGEGSETQQVSTMEISTMDILLKQWVGYPL